MEFCEIEKLVNQSLSDLYNNDSFLLKNDVCERSITHRLAIYLQNNISKLRDTAINRLDVDCEYNRNKPGELYAPKKLIFDTEELCKQVAINFGQQSEKLLEVSCYPDIIVHRRGDNDSNLLVIEVKKESSQIKDSHDINKLKAFTKKDNYNKYDYSYGVFIKLDMHKARPPECQWYVKGQKRPTGCMATPQE